MFAQSRNIAITGGTFVDIRGEAAFEKLERACAPNAFHNSSARCDYDRPKCHPNTRVAILEYLMGWIFGRKDPEALILWLYGPAGAGKSAILQTIAERCFERKVLLASFFFSRSDPSRSHFKPLVATIACQIAVAIPELKLYIENVIQRDPHLSHKSIATQVQSLVIEPLTHLAASGFFDDLNTCARLILIDALDECDDPRMQSEILRAIAGALRGRKIPLIFLISSRPEQSITLTFNSSSLTGLWRSLVLDDSFKPNEDILRFLNDSFQEIKASHPLRSYIPEAWPVQSDIDKLAEKSSGQFIFASVVVKYVSAHDDRPLQRLEVIMGLRPARSELPFAELDEVYKHILASCKDSERVHHILELIITELTLVWEIEMLLDLEPGDVEIALAPLRSILTIRPQDPRSPGMIIVLSHASFGDFLLDSSRSTRFYINKLTVKEHNVFTCIRKLMDPPSFASNTTPLQFPPPWQDISLMLLGMALHISLNGLPLSETVENTLKEFSLLDMWTAWSPKSDIGRLFPRVLSAHWGRSYAVTRFLDVLLFESSKDVELDAGHRSGLQPANDFDRILPSASHVTQPDPIRFAEIYTFHISSFEPVFKSELTKYYHNEELTSLVVLLTTSFFRSNGGKRINYLANFSIRDTIMELMPITKELWRSDEDPFDLVAGPDGCFISSHYRYLFNGTNKSAGVGLDGVKYAGTALRILNFLCTHPPRSLPYRYRRMSTRRGVSTQSAFFPSSRTATRKRRTRCCFLRKLREKYCRGATLSLPQTETQTRGKYYSRIIPSEAGLKVLPEILERSSKSPELVSFIRTHGKDIAFLPKWTRKAIRAMHEYLDRPDEDVVNKFALMVIE